MRFSFKGEISSSKSLFNRALIAQSFSEHIQIHGLTQSDDVLFLQKALKAFKFGEKDFFCGDGGTTFRFLALRVSRTVGEYKLTGSTQLFSRPIKELLQFFDQVSVEYKLEKNSLLIKSKGWQIPTSVFCTGIESSQFLSGIVLSSWDLKKELKIILPRKIPSIGYLKMTLDLMRECGAQVQWTEGSLISDPFILVAPQQKPQNVILQIEQDMSSLFTLAACAIMGGEVEIKNIPLQSLQPDYIFFEYFQKMKILFKLENKTFFIRMQNNYKGIEADLTGAPDLFPVLAVLAARAQGISTFTGLQNLKHKESDRYENTIVLLEKLGRRFDKLENGLMIHGKTEEFSTIGDFDPRGDHRMAMAAQVANLGGAQLSIKNKSVTQKSFPEFWSILGEEEQ